MGANRVGKTLVVIVDQHENRSRCVMSLVDQWARPLGRQTACCAPDKLYQLDRKRDRIALIVLSAGRASLADDEMRDLSAEIRERLPDMPILALSALNLPGEAVEAAQLGHQGYLHSSAPQDVARQAFASLLHGGTWFSREALIQLVQRHERADTQDHREGSLTPRQNEVLNALKFGKSNKLIARELDMQESTVKVHVRQIMRKFGVINRTQIALIASAHGAGA